MSAIPLSESLGLAGALLVIGLAGVLTRRDLIFTLLSIEVMLNASALAFIAAGSHWHSADGQVFFLFILATAATEVAVGLALVLHLFHRFGTLDADALSQMKG